MIPFDPMPDIAAVSVWTGFRRQLPPQTEIIGKLGTTRGITVGDANNGRSLFQAEVVEGSQLRRLYGVSGVITVVPEPGSKLALASLLSVFVVFRGEKLRRP